jgi:hypothetical protein
VDDLKPKAEPKKKKVIQPKQIAKKGNKITMAEQKELDGIEGKIFLAEEFLAKVQKRLGDPAVQSDSEVLALVCREMQDAPVEVDKLYERWDYLESRDKYCVLITLDIRMTPAPYNDSIDILLTRLCSSPCWAKSMLCSSL